MSLSPSQEHIATQGTTASTASGSSDIFSITDQVLAERLHFTEEIGFGNWGSVWLCQPKTLPNSETNAGDGLLRVHMGIDRVAVKLVHRSKTPTTAARVRSLWNEMKVVRALRGPKGEPGHPSIVPFHAFVITPSYALITMEYLPTPVPVEVPERTAKPWFRALTDAVAFLHDRGVVHNDIKPANILLSRARQPVLVDFGFSERYECTKSDAFISNLAYGTPEYLSPERARGLTHDTRKADVWSLGVCLFEILIGRTPFEYVEGEQCSTPEELEAYWSRTMRGKWVGKWTMSHGAEKLLRRMISPNADLRCTASQSLDDPYWDTNPSRKPSSHSRSISAAPSLSYSGSLGMDNDTPSRLLDISAPWSRSSSRNKENQAVREDKSLSGHGRSKSQGNGKVLTKRPVPSATAGLSPIKASPPTTPTDAQARNAVKPKVKHKNKENSISRMTGVLSPHPQLRAAVTPKPKVAREKSLGKSMPDHRRSRALVDVTVDVNVSGEISVPGTNSSKTSEVVRDRMRDWERERERLREMTQLEDREKESNHGDGQTTETEAEDWEEVKRPVNQASRSPSRSRTPPESMPTTPGDELEQAPVPRVVLSRTPSEKAFHAFKHNVRRSIDKTVRIYKASANGLGQLTSRTPSTLSVAQAGDNDDDDEGRSRGSISVHEDWEDEDLIRDAKSSLPTCRHAVHNERIAADNQADRMTIWMRNVEKVVEDARQSFAATSRSAPLPPMPLAPAPRERSDARSNLNRQSRLPRRMLAANEIFTSSVVDVADQSMMSASTSMYITANISKTQLDADKALPAVPAESTQMKKPGVGLRIQRPNADRRSKVVSQTAEVAAKRSQSVLDHEAKSPPKKDKLSASGLFRAIRSVTSLEFELQQQEQEPPASPRLSEVLDRSVFIAPTSPTIAHFETPNITVSKSVNFDDLNASPLHVEPYPPRVYTQSPDSPLDSPSQRRIEGVYDRFLMATSGVKRNGKGYQSDNAAPVHHAPHTGYQTLSGQSRRRSMHFQSLGRRPMPPPVSSDDLLKATSVDELGIASTPNYFKEEGNHTVAFVRRAIKAVKGKGQTKGISFVR